MEDMMFMQNVAYCLFFAVSGVIILRTLKRFDMQTAYLFCLALFSALMLYVPFYFGGRLAAEMIGNIMDDSLFNGTFMYYMSGTLSAPFAFVRSISTGTMMLALITLSVSFAVTVCVVVRFVHYVTNVRFSSEAVTDRIQKYRPLRETYVKDRRNTYKLLLKLRN